MLPTAPTPPQGCPAAPPRHPAASPSGHSSAAQREELGGRLGTRQVPGRTFPWPSRYGSLQRWLPFSRGQGGNKGYGEAGSTFSEDLGQCESEAAWGAGPGAAKAAAAGAHRAGKKFIKQITGQQSSYSQKGATLAQHEVHLRSAKFSASSIVPLLYLYSCSKDSYCLLLINLLQKCFSVFANSSPLTWSLPCQTAPLPPLQPFHSLPKFLFSLSQAWAQCHFI